MQRQKAAAPYLIVKCMKSIYKKSLIFFSVIVMVAGVSWYFYKTFEYTLSATVKEDGTIIIQTLSLGEYYTPVTNLEISESETGNKLISFVAKSGNSGMHTITLRKGVNQLKDLYLDGFIIKISGKTTHAFQPGIKYTVMEICF